MGATVTMQLQLQYRVEGRGEIIALGESGAFGGGDVDKAPRLSTKDNETWEAKVTVPLSEGLVVYKYGVLTEGTKRFEAIQTTRSISLDGLEADDVLLMRDTWRSPKSNVFVSSAFREAIFAGSSTGKVIERHNSALGDKSAATLWKKPGKDEVTVRLLVVVPRLTYGHTVHITGASKLIGAWDPQKVVDLVNMGRNLYSLILRIPRSEIEEFEYKYAIYDEDGEFKFRERGTPRKLLPVDESVQYVSVDENFKYETVWKGAGVAIPVFSLRSEESMGIGEFLDLKGVVDWACLVGLKLIQVLPVNDSGDNASPYSATSVFALHPVYLNMQETASSTFGGSEKVPTDIQEAIQAAHDKLKPLKEVDYTAVLEAKTNILEMIYSQGGSKVLADATCKNWMENNSSWLPAYACWKTLLKTTGEWVFTKWEYTVKDVPKLMEPSSKIYDSARFHCFVQYHLHKQLLAASNYAKSHGVALKGDLPIGVARYCADTWTDTQFFKMDWSAGAPSAGPPPAQNWDFPLYNWDEMKKDGYRWWRRRLQAMEEYFQAFRIDHVLGFFRIWAIPASNYTGLLGRYEPCPKPITTSELKKLGVKNFDRLTKPFIRKWLIEEKFGGKAAFVIEHFLDKTSGDEYDLKPEVNTQAKVAAEVYHWKYNELLTDAEKIKIREGLFHMIDDRILIQDEQDRDKFYLTCHLFYTTSWREFEEHELKHKLDRLWHNFFWERQSWREDGYEKLSAMQDAASMMICAEDLGAVPAEAYKVLDGLGILGLRIQRWPIEGPWGDPAKYGYLTVCAPSCHDCSTVRQWWTEDRGARQHFYRCNFEGEAPWECYDWVSQKIIRQHLESGSMWAIIPLQDYMDMWDELRSPNPYNDQINHPGTSEGNWVYRMKLTLKELCKKEAFTNFLSGMVQETGRVNSY